MSEFPRKPIKVIVPFAAGGGSDTFGRVIQSAIDGHQLLPQKMAMINVPGAGGTIGSRRVKNAQPDGYTVLLLHEGILTAKFSGQAAYGPEAFEPIVGTGSAPQIIAVAKDSPFNDLTELMDEVANRPDEIVYAANIGAPSYFAGLMLEQQKQGALFRYAQAGGGAKRYEAIQGGHVDVSSFSLAEYDAFRSAGIRALAVLSPKRSKEFPDLPTAREQGFDVVSQNMQYWWAPRGTPRERLDVISSAISTAMNLPEVREKLSAMKIETVTLTGVTLNQDIERRSQSIASVSQREIGGLPNLPRATLFITIVLGFVAFVKRERQAETPSGISESSSAPAIAVSGIGLTMLYLIVLQFHIASFVSATAIFVFLLGALVLLSGDGRRRHLSQNLFLLAILAVAVPVGIHFVFTQILVVDLP